jgi:hypothetical protein
MTTFLVVPTTIHKALGDCTATGSHVREGSHFFPLLGIKRKQHVMIVNVRQHAEFEIPVWPALYQIFSFSVVSPALYHSYQNFILSSYTVHDHVDRSWLVAKAKNKINWVFDHQARADFFLFVF